LRKDGSPIKRSEGGKIILKPGDEGSVFVTNNTGEKMFITVIYLRDSGEIETFPTADTVNAQQELSSDNKPIHLFDISDVTAPNGKEVEVLKLIATPRPADFSQISFTADERKNVTKGPPNPLEELLLGIKDAQTKDGKIKAPEIDKWYSDQIIYEIQP
jgi:hypothetical protein